MDEIWHRILAHEGETFYTYRELPFTYVVIGRGRGPIRVIREGREINRNISRASFEKAWPHMLCDSPSEIPEAGIVGRSYVWGILADARIRGG